ncbi:MAG: HAD family hydrolase [Bacteroidales bacterium]|nr:HAD family hydrolase [Bacteroidales bacterium]MBR5782275.1 HAD family hydrolase [Bacteroidales bacterium]
MDWNNIIKDDWTLFLDRDGVINVRIIDGYVKKIEEFEFLPGVIDAFKIFKDRFRRLIIVTNQQGIGKSLMTIEDVDKVHDFMIQQIERNGGRIDKIYCCPQLKSVVDNYRKPSPKMAYFAKEDFPDIDLSKSIMVGDMNSDIEFGMNAGMKTVFVGDNELKLNPDARYDSLYDFAKSL